MSERKIRYAASGLDIEMIDADGKSCGIVGEARTQRSADKLVAELNRLAAERDAALAEVERLKAGLTKFHSPECPHRHEILVGNCCEGNDAALSAMKLKAEVERLRAVVDKLRSGAEMLADEIISEGKFGWPEGDGVEELTEQQQADRDIIARKIEEWIDAPITESAALIAEAKRLADATRAILARDEKGGG